MLDDAEPYPEEYQIVLGKFWTDPGVQSTLLRANEAPIPEKCAPPPSLLLSQV